MTTSKINYWERKLLDQNLNFEHLWKIAAFVIIALVCQIYIYCVYGNIDITTWSYGNIGVSKWSRIFMFLGLTADWINCAGFVYVWWVINKFNKLLPGKHQVKGISALFIIALLLTVCYLIDMFVPDNDVLLVVIVLLAIVTLILQFYVSVKMIKQWNVNTENYAIQNTSFAKLGKCLLWYSILSLLVVILSMLFDYSIFPLVLGNVIDIAFFGYMCVIAAGES